MNQATNCVSDNIEFAFGQVRHTRLLPKPHAFAYKAFYLRVPIHALGQIKSPSKLFGINRAALLSFFEKDHGDGQQGLHQWVTQILSQEGLNADGKIWLHTFSRVLGYKFKPVSFWMCENMQGQLIAVIAEVNNTFGEKHLYLLSNSGTPLKQGQLLSAKKMFHVSPFFKIDGQYQFRFAHQSYRSLACVDLHLEQGLALRTSLSGQHHALTTASARHALLAYPFFSMGVIAKIHWQAVRLWLGRGLPYISKPNPPKQLTTKGQP